MNPTRIALIADNVCRRAIQGGLVTASVEVPPPAPDVVPLPPSPHPVPPPEPVPPEIIEPPIPGGNEPIRDPIVPTPVAATCGRLH